MTAFKLLKALFFKKGTFYSATSESRSRTLILPRKYYIEEQLTLPITNIGEIRKAIKNTHLRNTPYPQADFFFYINSKTEKSAKISLYVLKPQVSLPEKLTLVVPESLLFRSAENKVFQVQSEDQADYFVHSQSGVSLNTSPVIKNLDAFKRELGLESPVEEVVDSSKYGELLIQKFKDLNLKNFAGLLHNPNQGQNFSSESKKKLVLLGAALLVVHILNVGFQYFMIEQELSRVNAEKKKYRSAISMRQATENKSLKLQALLEKLRTQLGADISVSDALTCLKKPLDKFTDLKITSVEYQQQKLKLNMSAENASDVLNSLSEHPLIASAAFVGGIRKNKDNTQSFTLDIHLKENGS